MPKRSGFTLIELLITISIIAIIASIGLVMYPAAQKNARDARRKDDLRSIKVALEFYYQQNDGYPSVANWYFSNSTQPWIPNLGLNYIPRVPVDPLQSPDIKHPWNDDQFGYAYWTNPDLSSCGGKYQANQFFALVTQLENKNDSQRNQLQDYTWCDGGGLFTTHGWSRYSFVVTSEY